MGDGAVPKGPPHTEAPSEKPLPLSVRLLGAGVRGARSVGKAAGIDRTIQTAAEEAMVAAIQSDAVERALVRVLQGPVVEDAVQGALESEAVKRALIDALDSELVDEVWQRLLASDEAQRLVERIAEAPELRAAISAQSAGFIEDIGQEIGEATRRLDGAVERIVRRVLFQSQRAQPTERAGAVTRGLAFILDGLIVNLGFSAVAAIAALVASFFSGSSTEVTGLALVLGTGAWLGLGAVYLLIFWSLAGQTPGMRFFGIRLGIAERGLPLRSSLVRLVGLALALLPLGLGLLGILTDGRRRGWQDRLVGVDVLYEVRKPTPAPWSTLDLAEPAGAAPAVQGTGSGRFRPQHASGPPIGG